MFAIQSKSNNLRPYLAATRYPTFDLAFSSLQHQVERFRKSGYEVTTDQLDVSVEHPFYGEKHTMRIVSV